MLRIKIKMKMNYFKKFRDDFFLCFFQVPRKPCPRPFSARFIEKGPLVYINDMNLSHKAVQVLLYDYRFSERIYHICP